MKAELGPAFEQSLQQGQDGDEGESLGVRPAVWQGRTVCVRGAPIWSISQEEGMSGQGVLGGASR